MHPPLDCCKVRNILCELGICCSELLLIRFQTAKYGKAVSTVKQDESPQGDIEIQEEEEEQQKEYKGVKVDIIGKVFVAEQPLLQSLSTFSGPLKQISIKRVHERSLKLW